MFPPNRRGALLFARREIRAAASASVGSQYHTWATRTWGRSDGGGSLAAAAPDRRNLALLERANLCSGRFPSIEAA
jgi:hypothetical protein